MQDPFAELADSNGLEDTSQHQDGAEPPPPAHARETQRTLPRRRLVPLKDKPSDLEDPDLSDTDDDTAKAAPYDARSELSVIAADALLDAMDGEQIQVFDCASLRNGAMPANAPPALRARSARWATPMARRGRL